MRIDPVRKRDVHPATPMRASACFALRTLRTMACLLWLVAAAAGAADTPRLAGRVTDLAAVLSRDEVASLTRMLASYETEATHQIAVLTVPSLSYMLPSFRRKEYAKGLVQGVQELMRQGRAFVPPPWRASISPRT
jgi:uncharacterized membrane protein YgcG